MLAFSQSIVINEFLSANSHNIVDEDGDNSDWIEIYNSASHEIDLLGYGLSDDSQDPFKWLFPEIEIDSSEFRIVFASGKNRSPEHGPLHTNFRISSGGEDLYLTSPSGVLINHINTIELDTDVSFARIPDASNNWYTSILPTPSATNGTVPPLPQAPPPVFSHLGGKYNVPIELMIINSLPNSTIYFSLDGSLPDNNSSLYTEPITIDTTTSVRAITIHPEYSSSDIVTNSYIIDDETSLPIVSVVTDPANLWDWETGIYVLGPNADPEPPHFGANYYQDWRKEGSIEIFTEDNQTVVSQDIEMEIFGGLTRTFVQKSLKILSKTEPFSYQFYNGLPVFEYRSFILRNSGNDWFSTMLRDGFISSLASGLNIAHQSYTPSVVFLNGTYWGIHNIRERIDEHFLESHYNVDSDSVDIVKTWNMSDAGSASHFRGFMDSLEDLNLEYPINYQFVANTIDIENFIRYWAFEIYCANADWPGNNTRCWREGANGKYQWILYDTDMSYGLLGLANTNTLEITLNPDGDAWPNPPRTTLLFRKLVENQGFVEQFCVRFCDVMNFTFDLNRQTFLLDSLVHNIENEIPRHEQRWQAFTQPWSESIDDIRHFIYHRKHNVIDHLSDRFMLEEPATILINNLNTEAGRVWINGFCLDDIQTFQGIYFQEYPVDIWVECTDGYRFSGWTGSINTEEDSIHVFPENGLQLFTNFEEHPESISRVIINEINYKSSSEHNTEDWIEITTLHNQVDLSGWVLKDESDLNSFIIPNGTLIENGMHLIIARDQVSFFDFHPECNNVIGDFTFGLGSDSDEIRLFDQDDHLIDSVHYESDLPWPVQACGFGSTLQLVDPMLNNTQPHNWLASRDMYGSPGSENCLSIPEGDPIQKILPDEYGITSVYPNPCNGEFTLSFMLPENGDFQISIYNIQGREIASFPHITCRAGVSYHKTIGFEDTASGIYFITGTMKQTGKGYLRKVIYLK